MNFEELFGEPSELLVQETVFIHKRNEDDWPSWMQVVADLVEWLGISESDADARVWEALRREDVKVTVQADPTFRIALGEEADARLTRLFMAIDLAKDQEREVG